MTTNRILDRLGAARVALLPLLAGVVLAAWSVASPVGSSPDEDFHLTSAWCAYGDREDICATTNEPHLRVVPEALVDEAICYAHRPAQSAACQGAEFGLHPEQAVITSRGNFTGLYSGGYYMYTGLFASDNVERSVVGMRLANIALTLGLLIVCYWALPTRRRILLVVPVLVTAVPYGTFLTSSVNPSGWAHASAAAVFVSVVGYYETTGKKQAILSAVAAFAVIIGGSARSDAAVWAALAIVAATVVSASRAPEFRKLLVLPTAFILFSFVLWASAKNGTAQLFTAPEGAIVPSPSEMFQVILPNISELWAGTFGSGGPRSAWGLGWEDTPMPGGVWVSMLALYSATLFAGLRAVDRRKGLALGIVLFALVAAPTYVQIGTSLPVGYYTQPRYLVPVMIILVSLALYRREGTQFSLSRPQWWTGVTLITLAHAIALHTNIRRYVTGLDEFSWNLDTDVEWWWDGAPAPSIVWLVGTVAFGAVVVLALRLVGVVPIAEHATAPQAITPSGASITKGAKKTKPRSKNKTKAKTT